MQSGHAFRGIGLGPRLVHACTLCSLYAPLVNTFLPRSRTGTATSVPKNKIVYIEATGSRWTLGISFASMPAPKMCAQFCTQKYELAASLRNLDR